jgi:23S rRNA-/tRNA-specific pseudouridylate synthase
MAEDDSFWSTLPLGPGVVVVGRDANGLAGLGKPAGVLSHPNVAVPDPRALLYQPYQPDGEYYEWTPPGATGPSRLYLLNRLDSPTSGVILVAADPALAASIRELFQRKRVRKVYQALVFGAPPQPVQLWRDWLRVEKSAGQIRTGTGGQLMAETQATVIRAGKADPPRALLRLEPRTGRSHQLRVQCATRGLPIVGDQTYGDFKANRGFARATGERRLFLHALETSFDYEWQGRTHRFVAKAPLPPEFLKSL